MHEEKYLTAYFGRQHHYYLSKYLSYHSGDKFQFNADAFFVGIFWFLYRKLFVELLIIFSALIFISVAEELLYIAFAISEAVQNYIFYLSMPVFGTFWGFAGNYLYIKKQISKLQRYLQALRAKRKEYYY